MTVDEMKTLVNYVDAMDPRVFRDDAQRKAATWSWIDVLGWVDFPVAKTAVSNHYQDYMEPITVAQLNRYCNEIVD